MNNFENTYNQNFKRLFGFALKITNDKEAAGDIVHDVFIVYYQKLKQNHEILNPPSWLLRSTINRSIDYSKKLKRNEHFDEAILIISESDFLEKKEVRYLIHKALNELKPHEKALILLYNEGISYKEISEITEMNFASVGKTISRTLLKLKKLLKTYDHEMFR